MISDEGEKHNGLSTFVIIIIVASVLLLNVLIIIACRVYLKKRMHSSMRSANLDDRITSAVTSYMALKEK